MVRSSSGRGEEKETEASKARQDFNAALSRVIEPLRRANQSLSEFSSQEESNSARTAKTSELSQVLIKEINTMEREPNSDLKVAAAQRAIAAVEACKKDIYGEETLKKSSGLLAWAKKKIKEHSNAYVSVKDIFMNFNEQNLPARLGALTEANERVKRFATAAPVSAAAALEAPPLLSTFYAKPATKTEATTEQTPNPSTERNDRFKIE